jgi:preprotein translocase subunit SecE
MNSKAEQHKSGGAGDIVMYALALLLAAGGVFAYLWFENWSGPMRSGAGGARVVDISFTFSQTASASGIRPRLIVET